MILTFFIYTNDMQQGLSDSTVCKIIYFSLPSSCVQMMIYDYSIRLQALISTIIFIQFDYIMKKHYHLLLDFNEIFPHSTSRINR
jgi:hypothetical protein